MRAYAIATAVLFLAFNAHAATSPAETTRIVLPPDVIPTHYDIDMTPDAARTTFAGSVKIDIDVVHATRSIVLNAAELTFNKVVLAGVAAAPVIVLDAEHQTATFTFPSPVSAGAHTLSIDYAGKINQHASGLFALDYDSPGGKKRALYTQFENSDARRFVPCWDEPARKATFTLAATVPTDDIPVSNTPIATTEKLAGGLKRVHFGASPKMSSYLLFFGSGDFERVSKNVDGVDIGVVVKRGDTESAQFALDAAAHILPYYEDYFGTKYPLPKLDLIAAPGQSQFFGAMENWGAILFFESDLLIDSKISTQGDRRGVYEVVAHEMAHQWFGDLVTMAWWDDLWLNEGFASWMELKATDRFHPEWHMWLQGQAERENAMALDARTGTHPIIQPIDDVLQASEAFDTITYIKGEAVIRMLENFVGEDAFRAGVREYIKAHAYGNTVTDDFWRALDTTSSTPVTQIAHDFTLQAGVPLIRVTTTQNGIQLGQDRFTVDASGRAASSWRVPVTEQSLGSDKPWHGIVARDQSAEIAVPNNEGAVVNTGQASYLRTLYDAASLKPLVAHFSALSAENELGLINDTSALGYSGYEPLSDFLELASQAAPDMDPVVLIGTVFQLQNIDGLYRDLPGQPLFRAFGRRVLRPIVAKTGWTTRPGESQNTTLLRGILLGTLSQFDDPTVVSEARRRFAIFVKDPTSLSADLRGTVLGIVAAHADSATWEQLHTLAKNSKNTVEKDRYFMLLGSTLDRDLANRALLLALSNEAVVTSRPAMISRVSGRYPQLAFDFTLAHLDEIMAMIEPDSRNQFVPGLVSNAYDAALIPKLDAYAAEHIPASAQQAVVKSKSGIEYNASVRAKRLPDIDRWLASHAQQK